MARARSEDIALDQRGEIKATIFLVGGGQSDAAELVVGGIDEPTGDAILDLDPNRVEDTEADTIAFDRIVDGRASVVIGVTLLYLVDTADRPVKHFRLFGLIGLVGVPLGHLDHRREFPYLDHRIVALDTFGGI